MRQSYLLTIAMLCIIFSVNAQKGDTVYINGNNIHPEVLREGTHRYLVYFKKGENAPRSDMQVWTINIKKDNVQGRPVIQVDQDWDFKDTVFHKSWSVCDAKTLQPITHKTWWNIARMGEVSVDFENRNVAWNGSRLSDADTSRMAKAIWNSYKTAEGKFLLNWHLDLEMFSTLPYKEGAVFVIPFYDPGTRSPLENALYTVKGSAMLEGYNDQKIECWLLAHESDGNKELFWISKKTREVLKLEQQFGKMYRFKIKLPSSN